MSSGIRYGDYFLLGRLAVGGMAEVFLAKRADGSDRSTLFALKRTLMELRDNLEFVEMFADETQIVRSLGHPNICSIIDHGDVEGQPYIVMEFIHGKDLTVVRNRARRRNEKIPPRYVAYALARIARALHSAHNQEDEDGNPQNIVHRDVGPQNILISYDGTPKLIDFGIAKARSRISKTKVGIVKGKFGYMAPEQAMGMDVDWRTDVFALGATLYELMTGTLPFEGDNDLSTLRRIAKARYKDPAELDPNAPEALVQIVDRALQREPDDRYPTAMAMAHALERYVIDDSRQVEDSQLSAYMRKMFRDDYIRESARIKGLIDVDPKSAGRRRKKKAAEEEIALNPADVEIVEERVPASAREARTDDTSSDGVLLSQDLAAGYQSEVSPPGAHEKLFGDETTRRRSPGSSLVLPPDISAGEEGDFDTLATDEVAAPPNHSISDDDESSGFEEGYAPTREMRAPEAMFAAAAAPASDRDDTTLNSSPFAEGHAEDEDTDHHAMSDLASSDAASDDEPNTDLHADFGHEPTDELPMFARETDTDTINDFIADEPPSSQAEALVQEIASKFEESTGPRELAKKSSNAGEELTRVEPAVPTPEETVRIDFGFESDDPTQLSMPRPMDLEETEPEEETAFPDEDTVDRESPTRDYGDILRSKAATNMPEASVPAFTIPKGEQEDNTPTPPRRQRRRWFTRGEIIALVLAAALGMGTVYGSYQVARNNAVERSAR